MNKINKANIIKNPNKYVWIWRAKDSVLISDNDIKLKLYNKTEGIAFYWKEEESNVLVWRFTRSKGWTEDTAKLFAISFAPDRQQVEEALKTINEWDGKSDILKYNIRKAVYDFLQIYIKKYKIKRHKTLNKQFIYKNTKKMKEKMKKLAELSNQKFHEFIEDAQKARMEVVKSEKVLKATQEKGFKFQGIVKAHKEVVKNEDGKETEKWIVKTTFTSNKADLYDDITSKKAIKGAVEELKKKGVIPIRFEHESDDYGVWEEFKTYEKDGVLYGEAIGELDQNLSRSKDLWTEIYEYGKQFATSYGGRWVEFHWLDDEDTGEVIRVLDEIVIEEISLTTRPANPDTALEAINKYAAQLEDTLDKGKIDKFISNSKNVMKNKKEKLAKAQDGSTTEEDVLNPDEQETSTDDGTTSKEDTQANEDKKTEDKSEATEDTKEGEDEKATDTETDESDDKSDEEEKSTDKDSESSVVKSLTGITKSITDIAKAVKALDARIEKMEDQPEAAASVAKTGDDSGVDEVKEMKNIKKDFPMMYSLAEAQGLVEKE